MSVFVSMFSGPRNISTTMMRAFENRPDARVVDEPFYASYLAESGADHPYREETLRSQPQTRQAALEQIKTGAGDTPIIFEKHIAHHLPLDMTLDWLADRRVFILIRDPRAMVASYSKKYDDVAPIIDSSSVQRRIYEDCMRRDVPCPVVDAADALRAPRAMLASLCDALNIEFKEQMLSWPSGPRDSDGPWAPHWYDAVRASTGFRPLKDQAIALTPALESLAAQMADNYSFFHKNRIMV
ncbi:MAG: HAD family hydrolase [Pseudomonadota bacterium]